MKAASGIVEALDVDEEEPRPGSNATLVRGQAALGPLLGLADGAGDFENDPAHREQVVLHGTAL
jgi:hypothetical protein